jgi:GAF domain-containing protein
MTTGARDLRAKLLLADAVRRAPSAKSEAGKPGALDPGLSSFIRLSLDDPRAALLLQNAAAYLARSEPVDVTATILDEVMALTGADRGNVQIAEHATGELRIVTHAGFDQEFLEYFAVVDDGTSACGRAAEQHAQTVITDVDTDEAFAPHRDIAAASKFRAVQSTPLIAADGNLIGMVSTHFPRPGAPSERALELTRLYGMVSGEALARSLNGRTAPGLERRRGGDRVWPRSSSALPRATILELTDTIVRALLSAGLSLEAAQSLIGDGAASERVAAATDELDKLLGGVRSAVLELHT